MLELFFDPAAGVASLSAGPLEARLTDRFFDAAVLTGALALGLIGGVFLSFSDFIMKGLGEASPAGGMQSMQQLNRRVYGSAFLFLFMQMTPAAAGLALWAHWAGLGAVADWLTAGAAIYAVTVFGVTAAGNVPMNKHLDQLDSASAEGAAYWERYLRRWTGLNHVRTAGSLAAAACFMIAILERF